MMIRPGHVLQETIKIHDGGQEIISYLDKNGEFSLKYSYNAVNMLIQTYNSDGVLVSEELKENPSRDKYEESEHSGDWVKTVIKISEEVEKTGLNHP